MTGKRFLQGLAEGVRYLLNFLMETLKILLMSAQSVVDGLDSRLRGRSRLPNITCALKPLPRQAPPQAQTHGLNLRKTPGEPGSRQPVLQQRSSLLLAKHTSLR